ncbi:MAG: hypothetical protein ACLTWO_03740 [Blautia massiliensis (ex Durand et al. 2017)]|nr:MAG: hypothetical protein DBX91_13630 [Subdoligranulum variabile]
MYTPSPDEILPGRSINDFLKTQQNWRNDTAQKYRRYLYELRDYMAAHGPASPRTIWQWQVDLQERGYQDSSINLRTVAANHYFRWCGCFNLVAPLYHSQPPDTPEMTRNEYLRLLRAARQVGHHRTYLLIKLFALTDLPVQCIGQITAELVRTPHSTYFFRDEKVSWHCPDSFRTELLKYIEEQHIVTGPIFTNRTGSIIERSQIWKDIRELCCVAGVPDEKGNPRALRKLCRSTQSQLMTWAKAVCWQAYTQLLDDEQEQVMWTD